ncbi:unnamed protein product [Prorocentrum cordatum]|uniref:Uncharacterized protein n=1 Tax=Prorocentrum cordatum TaxID=2364126 RepID=A0ABN9TUZ4_9DINO|nr:unnamed protein product [Polarella glacialis]
MLARLLRSPRRQAHQHKASHERSSSPSGSGSGTGTSGGEDGDVIEDMTGDELVDAFGISGLCLVSKAKDMSTVVLIACQAFFLQEPSSSSCTSASSSSPAQTSTNRRACRPSSSTPPSTFTSSTASETFPAKRLPRLRRARLPLHRPGRPALAHPHIPCGVADLESSTVSMRSSLPWLSSSSVPCSSAPRPAWGT